MKEVNYEKIYELMALQLEVTRTVMKFVNTSPIYEVGGVFEMGMGILESLNPVKDKIAKLFEESCKTDTHKREQAQVTTE